MKRRNEKETNSHNHKPRLRVPKVCGSDIELANFVLGAPANLQTDILASRMLLREVQGWPKRDWNYSGGYSHGQNPQSTDLAASCSAGHGDANSLSPGGSTWSQNGSYGSAGYNPQDWGRRFLATNGGCIYIDLNHLEICTPETISAYDYVAASRAMLEAARQARVAASSKLPEGWRIGVLANNVDGHGHTYGSHCNFLVTKAARSNIFDRKLQFLLYLAAFQVSSIIYTGQGKVGSDNGQEPCQYQISQRADFFEVLTGAQTTYNRPIVNSRNESLCGPSTAYDSETRPGGDLQRIHCIFYDHTLCQVATLLKMGVMQIVLSMIEAEKMNPNLILDDPLAALWLWSHDPTLTARARTASGARLTAAEHQLLFCEEAATFIAGGGCDGIVPRAGDIHSLWKDTLTKLRERDLEGLSPRIDWILKKQVIETAMCERPDLDWQSPAIKKLDLVYSDIDPEEGIFWEYERIGAVECVVTPEEIDGFVSSPPVDTRAWTRAMLLRLGQEQVADVDWDEIRFRVNGKGTWPVAVALEMRDPVGHRRSDVDGILSSGKELGAILEELCAKPVTLTQYSSGSLCTCPSCTRKRSQETQQPEFQTAGYLPAISYTGGTIVETDLDRTP